MHKVDIRITRIFNTYVPYMSSDDGRVISNFIVQALRNQTLTINGNGNQTRSFCYVDDLINGMLLLMKSNYQKPVNLGNPNEFSILELANLIRDIVNPNARFEFKDFPMDDPTQRKPSIEVACKLLNWEPKIEIKDGLNKTIEWFKNNI